MNNQLSEKQILIHNRLDNLYNERKIISKSVIEKNKRYIRKQLLW